MYMYVRYIYTIAYKVHAENSVVRNAGQLSVQMKLVNPRKR